MVDDADGTAVTFPAGFWLTGTLLCATIACSVISASVVFEGYVTVLLSDEVQERLVDSVDKGDCSVFCAGNVTAVPDDVSNDMVTYCCDVEDDVVVMLDDVDRVVTGLNVLSSCTVVLMVVASRTGEVLIIVSDAENGDVFVLLISSVGVIDIVMTSADLELFSVVVSTTELSTTVLLLVLVEGTIDVLIIDKTVLVEVLLNRNNVVTVLSLAASLVLCVEDFGPELTSNVGAGSDVVSMFVSCVDVTITMLLPSALGDTDVVVTTGIVLVTDNVSCAITDGTLGVTVNGDVAISFVIERVTSVTTDSLEGTVASWVDVDASVCGPINVLDITEVFSTAELVSYDITEAVVDCTLFVMPKVLAPLLVTAEVLLSAAVFVNFRVEGNEAVCDAVSMLASCVDVNGTVLVISGVGVTNVVIRAGVLFTMEVPFAVLDGKIDVTADTDIVPCCVLDSAGTAVVASLIITVVSIVYNDANEVVSLFMVEGI